MKKYTLILFMILPFIMFGQTLEDALRYSRTNNYSTARSMGVAGAFGAMGADFGAISYNPATLGNYWMSEFNLSVGTYNGSTNTNFGEDANNPIPMKLSFNNIGFVTNSEKDSVWRSINFAIGLNKTANYNSIIDVGGNSVGSIIEDSRLVSGVNYDQYNDVLISKRQLIEESGTQKEMVVALGGNYKKKLLFGVSVGVPFINFITNREYTERSPDEMQEDLDFYFRNNKYEEYYSTVGVGFNIKAGLIYILPSNFRVGMAVHSPTKFKMKDDYTLDFEVDSRNYDFTPINEEGYFDYNFTSPWKFIGSLGKTFNNGEIGGFVNFDAEYVGYSSAKYNFRKYSSKEYDLENEIFQNREIRNELVSTFNFRLGSEIVYNRIRFRGGGALLGSPFKETGGYEPSITYSVGLGFREDAYYFDFAYLGTINSYSFYPYTADVESRSPELEIERNLNRFVATVGFKF